MRNTKINFGTRVHARTRTHKEDAI